jgi:hypothetical protein
MFRFLNPDVRSVDSSYVIHARTIDTALACLPEMLRVATALLNAPLDQSHLRQGSNFRQGTDCHSAGGYVFPAFTAVLRGAQCAQTTRGFALRHKTLWGSDLLETDDSSVP